MKITAIKPFVLDAGIYVKIETDEGIYGLGEGGMKRRGRAIAEVIHSMAPDLIGQDPFRIEHLWQVMFRGGFFPGGGIQTSAVSAVDIALWDIKGKALGVPVYELLGGKIRDKIWTYGRWDGLTPEAAVDNAMFHVEQGLTALKGDPFEHRGIFIDKVSEDLAVAKMRAVRDAVWGRSRAFC